MKERNNDVTIIEVVHIVLGLARLPSFMVLLVVVIIPDKDEHNFN